MAKKKRKVKRKSPVKKVPAKKRKVLSPKRKVPAKKRKVLSPKRKVPAKKRKVLSPKRPAKKRKVSSPKRKVPAKKRKMSPKPPAKRRKVSTKKRIRKKDKYLTPEDIKVMVRKGSWVNVFGWEYIKRDGSVAITPTLWRRIPEPFYSFLHNKINKAMRYKTEAKRYNEMLEIAIMHDIPLKDLFTLYFSP